MRLLVMSATVAHLLDQLVVMTVLEVHQTALHLPLAMVMPRAGLFILTFVNLIC